MPRSIACTGQIRCPKTSMLRLRGNFNSTHAKKLGRVEGSAKGGAEGTASAGHDGVCCHVSVQWRIRDAPVPVPKKREVIAEKVNKITFAVRYHPSSQGFLNTGRQRGKVAYKAEGARGGECGKFANIWSACSPDLNPPDFWLWNYPKQKLYTNNTRSFLTITSRCFLQNFRTLPVRHSGTRRNEGPSATRPSSSTKPTPLTSRRRNL